MRIFDIRFLWTRLGQATRHSMTRLHRQVLQTANLSFVVLALALALTLAGIRIGRYPGR